MASKVTAFAAPEASAPFEPYSYELPEIGPEDVDIKVEYCGICHSDLSMWQNAWGRSQFPLVARHNIEAMTEEFDIKDINTAFALLESGKARYRVVLKI